MAVDFDFLALAEYRRFVAGTLGSGFASLRDVACNRIFIGRFLRGVGFLEFDS
jgi:hypothetical protein